MTDRKKPGVTFWAAVVVVVALVVYPLSIGPACWLTNRDILPTPCKPIEMFYSPLNWIVFKSETATTIYLWYIGLWVAPSGDEPSVALR